MWHMWRQMILILRLNNIQQWKIGITFSLHFLYHCSHPSLKCKKLRVERISSTFCVLGLHCVCGHEFSSMNVNFLLLYLSRSTVWATSYRRSMGLRTKTTKKQRFEWKYYRIHESQCCNSSLIFFLCDFWFFQPSDDENSDNSNECVVCLSDLRDTLILPCRHLCLCNSCADTLRYQANNCPICRLRKQCYIILINSAL